MSRLDARIRDLERRLGRCTQCRPTIELVHAGTRRKPAPVERCPSCGEPQERIELHFAFDLLGKSEDRRR